MEKIVYCGDEYFYHRGKVYDCSYVEQNSGEAEEVLRDFYGKVDFSIRRKSNISFLSPI